MFNIKLNKVRFRVTKWDAGITSATAEGICSRFRHLGWRCLQRVTLTQSQLRLLVTLRIEVITNGFIWSCYMAKQGKLHRDNILVKVISQHSICLPALVLVWCQRQLATIASVLCSKDQTVRKNTGKHVWCRENELKIGLKTSHCRRQEKLGGGITPERSVVGESAAKLVEAHFR